MTGPTSEAGKARSSQNARKHGLSAENFVLSPEEQEKFATLERGLRSELRPQGEFEDSCFSRLLHSYWRLRLAQSSENQALYSFLQQPESEELQKIYERFFKYRRHHERSYERALRDLRLAQENRFLQANVNLPSETVVTPSLPLRQILRDFKKFQNELPQALCSLKVVDTLLGKQAVPPAERTAPQRRVEENRRLSALVLRHTRFEETMNNLQPQKMPNLATKSGFSLNLTPLSASRGAA